MSNSIKYFRKWGQEIFELWNYEKNVIPNFQGNGKKVESWEIKKMKKSKQIVNKSKQMWTNCKKNVNKI